MFQLQESPPLSFPYFRLSSLFPRTKTEQREMAGQAMKRIPRIKFPLRRPEPSDSSSQPKASSTDDALKSFLSRSASRNSTLSASGRASEQPKRTSVSNEEIEAILLGGRI